MRTEKEVISYLEDNLSYHLLQGYSNGEEEMRMGAENEVLKWVLGYTPTYKARYESERISKFSDKLEESK